MSGRANQGLLARPVGRDAAAGLVLAGGVMLGWTLQRLLPDSEAAGAFAPDWLPLVASGVAVAGIVAPNRSPASRTARSVLRLSAIGLLVWVANGLPFDLLTIAGLIGHRTAGGEVVPASVYWPGLATRACAVGGGLAQARLALVGSVAARSGTAHTWYAYAAFALALPYPVMRVHWATGGTIGLGWPGAAGEGWEPVVIAIPWMAAAVLSLLLVSPRAWIPRRLLLAAGWSATLIVAMIGPAALWTLVSAWLQGRDVGQAGIAGWVFTLFYGCWFLFAIAAAAATWSYQVRTSADLAWPGAGA